MKKILITSFLLLFGVVIANSASISGNLLPFSKKEQKPQSFITVQNTATTTIQVAKKTTVYLDSELTSQGACVKIKDEDGDGYTYLTTNKGVGIFSSQSCE